MTFNEGMRIDTSTTSTRPFIAEAAIWSSSASAAPVRLDAPNSNAIWVDGHAKYLIYGSLKRPMFSCRKDIYPQP